MRYVVFKHLDTGDLYISRVKTRDSILKSPHYLFCSTSFEEAQKVALQHLEAQRLCSEIKYVTLVEAWRKKAAELTK